MASALADLHIVDFSRVLAGPLATMLLGDLGADVQKIERPPYGDDTRSWMPPVDAHGHATYFASVNRNKRSEWIDFSTPEGAATARELCATADVIVENFRPGVMARHGLSYEQVREANPQVIYASITGFGPGDGAALPGYDMVVQALSGLMSITGEPGRHPQRVGVALIDVITGLFATVGILAAVHHRDRTGEGQHVEVNLMMCALAALVNQGAAYTVAGEVPRQLGNSHPSIAPYELFDTSDGEVVITVGNDHQFSELCGALGVPELTDDPRFANNDARVVVRATLHDLLQRELGNLSTDAAVEQLNAAGVPAGAVNNIEQAFALAERLGLSPTVDVGGMRLTSNPISLSQTPPTSRSAPPARPA